MTLDEARAGIGRRVKYRQVHRLDPNVPGQDSGVITSVNDTFVFVRYGTNQHSAATRPEDLDFE